MGKKGEREREREEGAGGAAMHIRSCVSARIVRLQILYQQHNLICYDDGHQWE